VAAGVRIGAQVSYRDLAGFGRRPMDVPPDELADEVTYQIGALDAFARAEGDRVRYVKPHGALYNRAVEDEAQAAAVVEGVRRLDPTLPILGLPGSALVRLAEASGMTAIPEGFADRAYTERGTLVSRREAGSVLHDPAAVVAQALGIAVDGTVTTATGERIPVTARSICLHGDTPGAAGLAARVRSALIDAGVEIAPFA
jgi:UPF0271 protein